MTDKSEKILAIIDHLYWFKDFLEEENKKDFLETIKNLIAEVTND